MGALGAEILHDDVAADVYADFIQKFERGVTPAAARDELEIEYAEYLADNDDMPAFWLAMARAQWECGQVQPDVMAKVSDIIATGKGLERWEVAGQATLRERKQELKEFLTLIESTNPRPRVKGENESET